MVGEYPDDDETIDIDSEMLADIRRQAASRDPGGLPGDEDTIDVEPEELADIRRGELGRAGLGSTSDDAETIDVDPGMLAEVREETARGGAIAGAASGEVRRVSEPVPESVEGTPSPFEVGVWQPPARLTGDDSDTGSSSVTARPGGLGGYRLWIGLAVAGVTVAALTLGFFRLRGGDDSEPPGSVQDPAPAPEPAEVPGSAGSDSEGSDTGSGSQDGSPDVITDDDDDESDQVVEDCGAIRDVEDPLILVHPPPITSLHEWIGPTWSPDGTRILFTGIDRDDDENEAVNVYVTHTAGGPEDIPLTDDGYSFAPAWSPDGSRIAFVRMDSDGLYYLYAIKADGSDERRIASHNVALDQSEFFRNPYAWSPDGTRIAFTHYSDSWAIYVVRLDGDEKHKITIDGRDTIDPVWSPDSKHLALTVISRSGSFKGGFGYFNHYANAAVFDDYGTDIFVASADGSEVRQLTRDATPSAWPAWSPDGSRIAFAAHDDGWDVFIVGYDGSAVKQLTKGDQDDIIPIWSPDGNQLIFTRITPSIHQISADSRETGELIEENIERIDLVMMNDSGSGQCRLTPHSPRSLNPEWSPDGTRIAFYSELDDDNLDDDNLFVTRADGTGLFHLSENMYYYAWSPDSTTMALLGGYNALLMLQLMSDMTVNEIIPAGVDEPQNVVVVQADGGLRVSWEAPRESNLPIARYRIQWKGSSESYSMEREIFVESDYIEATNSRLISYLVDTGVVVVRVRAEVIAEDGQIVARSWFEHPGVEVLSGGASAGTEPETGVGESDDANSPELPGIFVVLPEIIFTRGDPGDIYAVATDLMIPVQVTTSSRREIARTWSPDGAWIALDGRASSRDWEIWALNMHTREQRQLTCNSVNDWSASWSHDGRQLAFASGGSGDHDISLMDVASGEVSKLTSGSHEDYSPSWSPDGTQIAFVRGPSGSREIWIADVASKAVRQATRSDRDNVAPSWSPDGSRIAYANGFGTDRDIVVMDADGANERPVTGGNHHDDAPSWSPDGTEIVFARGLSGGRDILIVNVASGVERQLVAGLSDDYAPVWSPGITSESTVEPSDCSN